MDKIQKYKNILLFMCIIASLIIICGLQHVTTEQVPTDVRFLNTALMYWPVMKEYAASTYVCMYVLTTMQCTYIVLTKLLQNFVIGGLF